MTGTTQILIGSTGSLSGKSGVNGNAVLTINVSPEADGYGVGWASAGMAASRLKVTGKTLITANAGSKLASANGDVSLNAIQNITSKAVTTAAGGGYVGTGAAALAFVDIESETTINSAASVEAAKGTYGLLAQQILNAEVESKGLSVAFYGAIGAAVARMTVKPTVKAAISGGTIVAKNLAVKALFNVNNNSTYTKTGKITANALAGTGGGAVAASGAKAEITVDGSAAAAVENATVTLTGNADVISRANGSITGKGEGLSVAGLVPVGGVEVTIQNTFDTTAQIIRTTITGARNVTVLADYDGTVNGTSGRMEENKIGK